MKFWCLSKRCKCYNDLICTWTRWIFEYNHEWLIVVFLHIFLIEFELLLPWTQLSSLLTLSDSNQILMNLSASQTSLRRIHVINIRFFEFDKIFWWMDTYVLWSGISQSKLVSCLNFSSFFSVSFPSIPPLSICCTSHFLDLTPFFTILTRLVSDARW